MNKLGWDVLPYPPYSPEIASSDFYLFWSLHFLNGKKIENLDDVWNGWDILLKNQNLLCFKEMFNKNYKILKNIKNFKKNFGISVLKNWLKI